MKSLREPLLHQTFRIQAWEKVFGIDESGFMQYANLYDI